MDDAYPAHPLHKEATRQVAFVYRQSGQLGRAAGEYERIASEADDPALRGEALLVAGELYEQSKDVPRALASYGRYVAEFPQPVEAAVETRQKIATLHQSQNDVARYHAELEAIVRADAEAGATRTGRTRTLAARAALVLAEKTYAEFAAVRLRQPFETSLQVKQRLMGALTDALDALVEYEIAEVTAAATWYMAETYADFSRALMDSERPADLQAADREEYEMALEEEAFPFEEKAIRVHEKNLELLHAGVLNGWTEKSLGRLADLMPGRYARTETSAGFQGSMESYAYRTPAARVPVAPEAPAPVAPPAADVAAPDAPVQTTGLRNDDAEEVVAHATQR